MKNLFFLLLTVVSVMTAAISCKNSADGVTPNTTAGTAIGNSLTGSGAGDPVSVDSIPAAARTYLTTKYPGWTIKKAEVEKRNGITTYEVKIQKGTSVKEVVFDAVGAFLGEELQGAHGHHGGRRNHAISLDSLPTAIKTYIASNYAGDTIKRAEKRTINGVVNYAVLVDNGTRVKVLVFSATGTFIREATFNGGRHRHGNGNHNGNDDNISIDSLPQSIPLYITANYPGYTIKEAEKEKERSTNAIIYEVKIENGSTRKKLIFDATGAFLRVG